MRTERDDRAIEGHEAQDLWPVRLGRGIAVLRTGRRWSRKKLAIRLEVPYQRLGHWERGVCLPPIGKLIALGQILEVSIEELLAAGEAETSNPSPVPWRPGAFRKEKQMSTEVSCSAAEAVETEPEAALDTGTLPPLDPDLKAERVQEDATDPVPVPIAG